MLHRSPHATSSSEQLQDVFTWCQEDRDHPLAVVRDYSNYRTGFKATKSKL